MKDLLIKNGMLFSSKKAFHADILVSNGKITKVEKEIDENKLDAKVINAEGLCVLPGIIDSHTHYHLVSRGTATADGFKEGSKLASYGGVTTVIDFSDDQKTISLSDSEEIRTKEMGETMAIDYALHQGVYSMKENLEEQLSLLKEKGVRVIKIFTTYKNVGYMLANKEELKRLFSACKKLEILITAHCESDDVIQDINNNWKGGYLPSDHALLRPPRVEAEGIKMVGEIALSLDMPLYIVHLSSKEGLEEVRALRKKGAKLIVETTPHYLFLDKSKLEGENGPLYVMTPPLRDKEDNKALQKALIDGEIQVVATDHCSFTYKQKLESNDCRTIFPGIPGTEELLPLINTFASGGTRLSLMKVVELLSENPAKIFGLYPEKGSLLVGTDADFILFDPEMSWEITKEKIHSKSGYSCYEGMKVNGEVVMTYLKGHLVMGNGVYLGLPGTGTRLNESLSSAYK
ncbi:MAG: dihydroorotase [Sphaerochaetaceae bacterium]